MAHQYARADLTDVTGLVAVVTGGTRADKFGCHLLHCTNIHESYCTGGTGLGLTIAQALESNGAKVYITGRREEKLRQAANSAVSSALVERRHTASSLRCS